MTSTRAASIRTTRLAGHGPARPAPAPDVDHRFDDAAQVLIVGGSNTAMQAATMLAPDGVTTVVAADGREVLAHSPMVRPDVIVLDQEQSDQDGGGEVVRRLRSREGTRPTVVVLGEVDHHDGRTSNSKPDAGRGTRRRPAREYLLPTSVWPS